MLTSVYAPIQQAGNGIILAFQFSFKILAKSDLAVYTIDALGVQSAILVLNQDYTVSFDPVAENGTVTYTTAPVSGGYSLIKRVSDNTQQTSMPREGVAPAKTTETMIDKLTALIQEIQANASPAPVAQQSGLFSARPTAPTAFLYYYSTDRGSLEVWLPIAQRWFLIG